MKSKDICHSASHLCYNESHLSLGAIYSWVFLTYASGHPSATELTDHLAHCSRCIRQAAKVWAVLIAAERVEDRPLPPPDLSFLPPRGCI